jgi:NAD-dependent dihydropyrimidine dehydrogenase PreA subunit
MAKDLSTTNWHGVPRRKIPWFPTIDAEACIGCQLCYVTCGREVFDMTPDMPARAEATRQYNCMVGCSTCAMVCPTDAISFPDKELVRRAEREHRIFRQVRQEATSKRAKVSVVEARAAAEKRLAETTTRARVSIAGTFGEKRFLVKLDELLQDRPFDIVDLKLEVPTVKGLREKTPAFMAFGVTSTDDSDVRSFLAEVKELVRVNGLVWVDETLG